MSQKTSTTPRTGAAHLHRGQRHRTIRTEEVPDIDAAIWHLAGLAAGDIPNEMIPFAARHAMVAIDVQTMLRWVENGGMVYHDWAEKKELLPYVRFLKTDAAEAEILTGFTDRAEAARQLYQWGAKEILITHNTEVLVYDGREIYTCPIRARNLSGRTGRGDTTFAGYINERLTADIPHRPPLRHRLSVPEDGDPRPLHRHPGGCRCLSEGILLSAISVSISRNHQDGCQPGSRLFSSAPKKEQPTSANVTIFTPDDTMKFKAEALRTWGNRTRIYQNAGCASQRGLGGRHPGSESGVVLRRRRVDHR